MGRPIGPKKVHRYSMEFKLTAVKLSGMPGGQVQTVANALDIHPFMLSRWRKEVRDGMLRARRRRSSRSLTASAGAAPGSGCARSTTSPAWATTRGGTGARVRDADGTGA